MTVADLIEIVKLIGPAIPVLGAAIWAGVKLFAKIDKKLDTFIEVITIKLQAHSDLDDARHAEVDRRIEEHHRTLYGNGREGLDEEVSTLKIRVAGIDKIQEDVTEVRKASDGRIREYVFEYLRLIGFAPGGKPG